MDHYEKSLIGACLQSIEAVTVAQKILTPEDLMGTARDIFEAIIATDKPDLLTVSDTLTRQGKLEITGGLETLMSCIDGSLSSNAKEIATIIKARSNREKTKLILNDALTRLANETEDCSKIATETSYQLDELHAPSPIAGLSQALDNLEKIQTGQKTGFLSTGIETLDLYAPGTDELLVIGARPSIGKSALGLHYAEHVVKTGFTALFISIEMSETVVTYRRAARLANINLQKFRVQGALNESDWNGLAKAFDYMKQSRLYLDCSSSSLGKVVNSIKHHKHKHNISMAVIDHLHIMELPKNDRRDLQIKLGTRVLARLSKTLGISIILLAQLNRESTGSRPRPNNLRDCGSIEEDADNIWLLDRDGDNPTMQIYCDKFRNGQTGECEIGYRKQFGTFYELT